MFKKLIQLGIVASMTGMLSCSFFTHQKSYHLVDGRCIEISEKNIDVNPEYVAKIEKIAKASNRFFNSEDIEKLFKFDVDPEYLEDSIMLSDKKGLLDLDEIVTLHEAKIKPDYLKSMTNLESLGHKKKISSGDFREKIFTANEIIEYDGIEGTVQFAAELLKIPDRKGDSLFTGRTIIDFFRAEGTIEEAKYWASKTDALGEQKYSAKEIAGFKKTMITEDELAVYEGAGFNGFQSYRLKQLGLTVHYLAESSDVLKPTAIVIYPVYDYNGAFENRSSISIFNSLREEYNLKVVITDNENDIYKAIEQNANAELVYIAGHGSQDSLMLGRGQNEESKIDTSDVELIEKLSRINPDAVIFLHSCSAAKGGKNEVNLANFVMQSGLKVIASTAPFSSGQIDIRQVYPFDLDIEPDNECKYLGSLTYKN